ncbi:tail fiber domain-containing protein [Pseudomonas poae]|uniref:Peptidase S74 domain-containing protein n=1 Tax=Pseudomonas poae TaxID=200451 RepID=A0A2S9EUJ0_9PSED|nr:hypothetical protein CQZ97_01005 [Pseudomonas poae]PRC19593.1 hypothetical protein CQZ99_09600 [Pseudomonas poae]
MQINQSKPTITRWRSAAITAYLAMGLLSGFAAASEAVPQALERFQLGSMPVTGVGLRDGIVVSRHIKYQTDTHAFADKSLIEDVMDSGTYGAFDSTATLRGHNEQDHFISFQDRLTFSGSWSLKLLDGFVSNPTHSGTGRIYMRAGADIGDIKVTNGGQVDQNIGVIVQDLHGGANNAAIVLGQSTGHTIYSSGVAPSFHRSTLLFGPGNGPVINADARMTQEVRDLSRAEREVAENLKPLIKAYRQNGGGKIHVGVLAQDVMEAFKSEGLDAMDYAIINQEGDGLGVRYDELLAFIQATDTSRDMDVFYLAIILGLLASLVVVSALSYRRARRNQAEISRMDSELLDIRKALESR